MDLQAALADVLLQLLLQANLAACCIILLPFAEKPTEMTTCDAVVPDKTLFACFYATACVAYASPTALRT
jgi:hypothetical protein